MITERLMVAIIAICGALVVYHHVLYPLLLARVVRRRGRALDVAPLATEALPGITLIIPAYNEAAVIADKIRNLANLDYPKDRLRVILACDGCADDTAGIARATMAEPECKRLDLSVLAFPRNRGKVALLNALVPRARDALVALSDASALISPDALRRAAAHFRDPRVGVVAATYRLSAPGCAAEDTYWRYQTAIKQGEAALGAPLGVHGALYFLRRDLFTPLPADTINDDFVVPMEIVARGHRALYDTAMVALELETSDVSLDRRRRQRIAAGNIQQAIRLRRLLHPKYGGVAFAFASGKALRVLMPFCLLAVLACSAVLAPTGPIFAAFLAAQLLFYGIALYRHVAPSHLAPKAVEAVHYFVSGHLSGLVGVARYIAGLDRGQWRRAHDTKEITP